MIIMNTARSGLLSKLASPSASPLARRSLRIPTVPHAAAIHVTTRTSRTQPRQALIFSPAAPISPSTPRLARCFSQSRPTMHGHVTPPRPGEELYVTFVDKDGLETKIAVSEGDNLLDIAQANDLEMEGACGGSCACSTCHVIVADDAYYDRIPEPGDDENDMLDLAFGLTETSRLGCQVKMAKELDGLVVRLPSMTRNLQSGDFN